ncbi:MAG: efflux RND transporter periplasmic adaptor subunit [Gemmatimonadales bacterium]
MGNPSPDLSRLRIDRDRPSAGSRQALKFSVGLAVVAVVIVGAAFVHLRSGSGIEVTVSRVELVGNGGSGTVGITANGYVVARTKASISSKIPGRLEYLGVSEGSILKKGDIVARLENRDYAAALAQARAEQLSAEASLREAIAVRDQLRRDVVRADDLLARNLGSAREAEDLKAQLAAADARVGVQEARVKGAKAAVAVANANLENTVIRAPFSGTVLRKDAEVGEVVAPAATGGGLTRGAVVTMADLETLEVEVDVNEAYIAQIHDHQRARIVLDAYPTLAFGGAVRQIVPTADRQKATVQVKVSILDRDPRILPEMGARVEFLETRDSSSNAGASPRIFVPSEVVRNIGGETIVWVVRNGTVSRTTVEAGPVSGGRREILSGLYGGEQVVLNPPDALQDGVNVHVVTN